MGKVEVKRSLGKSLCLGSLKKGKKKVVWVRYNALATQPSLQPSPSGVFLEPHYYNAFYRKLPFSIYMVLHKLVRFFRSFYDYPSFFMLFYDFLSISRFGDANPSNIPHFGQMSKE